MSNRRVPDILIEQYVLGELPEEQARGVEQSEGFAERVAAIRADNDAFLRNHPPEAFVRRIENQYEAEEASRTRARSAHPARRARTVRIVAFAVPGAAAVLAFALVLFGGLGTNPPLPGESAGEIVRLKGAEPAISVYRATSSGDPQELVDGSSVRTGDTLQIAYNAGGSGYGTIISIDGNGAVTLHFPLTPSEEPELVAGGDQQLGYAYRLDDAPRFETFYFVTSDSSFSVADVLDQVRRQAATIASDPDRALRLDRGLDVTSVTLRKGE